MQNPQMKQILKKPRECTKVVQSALSTSGACFLWICLGSMEIHKYSYIKASLLCTVVVFENAVTQDKLYPP